MNAIRVSLASHHDRFLRRFNSPIAYHCVGGLLTIAILIATVGTSRSIVRSEVLIGDEAVELNEAIKLVAQADDLRKQYTVAFEHSKAIDARVDSARHWLPMQLNWNETEDHIRSIAEANDVLITSLEESSRHSGTRVAVAEVSCRARGTFAALSQFVARLHVGETAIACSEFNIERLVQRPDADPSQKSSSCTAMLTFRIPYAGENSLAAQLLVEP